MRRNGSIKPNDKKIKKVDIIWVVLILTILLISPIMILIESRENIYSNAHSMTGRPGETIIFTITFEREGGRFLKIFEFEPQIEYNNWNYSLSDNSISSFTYSVKTLYIEITIPENIINGMSVILKLKVTEKVLDIFGRNKFSTFLFSIIVNDSHPSKIIDEGQYFNTISHGYSCNTLTIIPATIIVASFLLLNKHYR